MKTFKHTFEDSQLVLIDGEVKEVDPVKYEATFSLTTASLLMFEEEYGQPLMTAMTSMIPQSALNSTEEDFTRDEILGFLNTKFIRALRCSTYLKIENGKIFNNEASKKEFKESPMNELCLTDFDFIQNIMSLATTCLYNEKTQKVKNGVPSKKK